MTVYENKCPVISKAYCEISDLTTTITKICHERELRDFLGVEDDVDKFVQGHLRNNLHCYIEYPYIDAMYRDTYYSYYSNKKLHTSKDCIRVSLFDCEIKENSFRDKSEILKIKGDAIFLGYFIIRPTRRKKIGRSYISPYALDLSERGFYICSRSFKSLINGVELKSYGFPHAVQDKEFHACAQICLFSTMEYFSKYPEFSSILPSTINTVLDNLTFQRQLPTEGLLKPQVSYFLKKMGFGVKMYNIGGSSINTPIDSKILELVLNDYIESGIPVIVAIKYFNKSQVTNNNLKQGRPKKLMTQYHAVICIGHESLSNSITNTRLRYDFVSDKKDFKFADSTQFYKKKYTFIDDDSFPYQSSHFSVPLSHHKNLQIESSVEGLIVPLHRQIFMDSLAIRNIFKGIINTRILDEDLKKGKNNRYIIRYLLTSGRSFKRFIVETDEYDIITKNIIESIQLSRFTWIIEISDRKSYSNGCSLGFIVVDATGASDDLSSIAAIIWGNEIRVRGHDTQFEPFITNNKKGYFPLFSQNLTLFNHEKYEEIRKER